MDMAGGVYEGNETRIHCVGCADAETYATTATFVAGDGLAGVRLMWSRQDIDPQTVTAKKGWSRDPAIPLTDWRYSDVRGPGTFHRARVVEVRPDDGRASYRGVEMAWAFRCSCPNCTEYHWERTAWMGEPRDARAKLYDHGWSIAEARDLVPLHWLGIVRGGGCDA